MESVRIIGRNGQSRNGDLEIRVGLDFPETTDLTVSESYFDFFK